MLYENENDEFKLAASVKKGCFVKHKLLKSTGMHSIWRFKQKQRARDDVGKGEGDPLWATLILLVLREREPLTRPKWECLSWNQLRRRRITATDSMFNIWPNNLFCQMPLTQFYKTNTNSNKSMISLCKTLLLDSLR